VGWVSTAVQLLIQLTQKCNATFDPMSRRFLCAHEHRENIIGGMASGRKNSMTF
jgi:hypothetical protein